MLPEINLLPKIERQSSVHYIIFLSGLILCLLLMGTFIYFYFNTRSNLEEVNQNISQLEQERTLLEQRLENLNMDNESNLYENAVKFVDYQIIPTSNFIDELIVLLPDNGYLSNYSYNYQEVLIETQFETMTAVAAYVEELNSSDFINNVQVNEMSTFEMDNSQQEIDEFFTSIPRYNVIINIEVDESFLIQEVEGNE